MPSPIDRRRFAVRAIELLAAAALGGCDRLSSSPWFTRMLSRGESLTRVAQTALTPRRAMAQEFSEADRSATFPSNGTTNPEDARYQELARGGFADWRLDVRGLVNRPLRFSLDDLRRLPSRTQRSRATIASRAGARSRNGQASG